MDTIIYFYQKRNLEEPLIEPIGQGRYLLVKVAMDVGDCRWFRMRLPAYGKPESPRPENVSKGIFQKWIATLAQCRNRRKQERRQRLWQETFRQMSGQVETQITKLVRQIGEYVEDWRECRCLYDEAVRKWLVLEEGQEEGRERGWLDGMDSRPYARLRTAGRGETGSLPEGDFAKHWMPRHWQKHWDISEFADFFSMDWVKPLLSMARLPHFVLLGTAPCVPDVILACAHRMRSLRWVLREKDVTQEILDEEKKVMMAQMENDPKMAGKPEQVREKIVMGKLNKFYAENCLLQQDFVKDGDMTVEKYMASVAKAAGASVRLLNAVRFEKGEGIEKKQENFAEEIAKLAK